MFDDRRAIDLSNGEDVVLVTSSAGGAAEQMRWAVRCDAFNRWRHRAIAALVDYGRIGEHHRFEAWRAGAVWNGDSGAAHLARTRARLFLRANAVTDGDLAGTVVRTFEDHPIVVPDAAAGYSSSGEHDEGVELDACGMSVVSRRAVSALADVFANPFHSTPLAIALWGPPGSGVGAAVDELARAARLHGFVPLDVRLASSAVAALLRGRSLCLIDRSGGAAGWEALLAAVVGAAKPHILLFAGREEVPRTAGAALEPLAAETLIAAVRPRALANGVAGRIGCAALKADGRPGRFVRLLWGIGTSHPEAGGRATLRVAEQPESYGNAATAASAVPARESAAWPAPGELAGLRRRMEAAVRTVENGSHARGTRTLRQVVGALARRRDWPSAAQGGLALAESLLRRGKAREAQTVIAQSGEQARAARDERLLFEAAVLAGRACTDLGRLDEAENLLRAAIASGDALLGSAPVHARLAFARCLFWLGRYDEAAAVVAVRENGRSAATDPMLIVASACVAVGRRDLPRAVALATDALGQAERLGNPARVSSAAYSAALAHLAVGDAPAVERDVAICIRAARAARDPLRALKARLIGAESARRAGRPAAAAALIRRIDALSGSELPPIVRARCALIRDLAASSSPAEIVARHVASTGLRALALFAPMPAPALVNGEPLTDDVLAILRSCQAADEDGAALRDVCDTLRTRMKAASIALFVPDGGGLVPVASSGARVEAQVAERVVAAGQTIAPHGGGERIEAGAAVRYGGRTLGALVARWPLGAPIDPARAASLLTMAATAASPAVAAAVARRSGGSDEVATELLGASEAMARVRNGIERAAAAPFAVLIEGESGSGKELVARALHRRSPRRDRPFCTLNCAAIPDDLAESELFGHARGAFTGAVAERPGVFEEAHTGTLFLDEIGELSLRAQAKILRTIQEGEVRRVGENISRRVDVRIVAATNRHLAREVSAGRFRLDLLYRLDVIRIELPPLRERRDDIAVLVEHFWRDAARRVGSRAVLSTATIAALAQHDWPGNVRELQNVLAALAVRSARRGVVPPGALPMVFGQRQPSREASRLEDARRTFEESFVRAALVRTGGHRGRAANELGVTRQGLTKLMARLGITE
jgi:DNA-binding NtrC family response regulator